MRFSVRDLDLAAEPQDRSQDGLTGCRVAGLPEERLILRTLGHGSVLSSARWRGTWDAVGYGIHPSGRADAAGVLEHLLSVGHAEDARISVATLVATRNGLLGQNRPQQTNVDVSCCRVDAVTSGRHL